MHILLVRLLQGAAIALILALGRVLKFAGRCLHARRRFLASDLPGPPLPSALLGHVPSIMGAKGAWTLSAWASQYGPLFKIMFLNQSAAVLTDPDAIARLTKRAGGPGPYCPKAREFYLPLERATQPPMSNILTSSDGPYWRAVRSATAPCFSMSNMKKVAPLVLELTHKVAERMAAAPNGLFDVTDGAKRITSDVMGQLLYDEDFGGCSWAGVSDYGPAYLELFLPVIRAQAAMLNNPWHLWQVWDPEVRAARRCIAAHDSLIDAKVRRVAANPPPEHTIAAHLLQVADPATGRPLTHEQLKAELAVFMAAGFETTSHAITWCLTMLAAHPDVQEQVFAELQAAGLAPSGSGSSPGRAYDTADWGRLPLLAAVTKEALRLCPPAPFGGSRQVVVEEGADVCGYHLPKGMLVMIPLLPLSLAKHTYGPDAAEFRPQRWMQAAQQQQEQEAGSGAPAAAQALPDPLTFLVGPRDCIGQNLAKLELQVVLTTLLSRFHFGPGPELARELQVAAATGQPAASAVHALAGVHITLQPLSGRMELAVTPRPAAKV